MERPSRLIAASVGACPNCDGGGKVLVSCEPPWPGSVLRGLVKPIECPQCKGTGKDDDHPEVPEDNEEPSPKV